jgi:hypothetical protein
MPLRITCRYATAGAEPDLVFDEGALCVCVEATSIRSRGILVRSAAMALASSMTSGDAPKLSTTTIASVVAPSASTSARACKGSCALVARFALKPPGMFSGNSRGVMSTAAAPARSIGFSAADRLLAAANVNRTAMAGRRSGLFMRSSGSTTLGWKATFGLV